MNGRQIFGMCIGVLFAIAFYLVVRFLRPKNRVALLSALIYFSGWLAAHGIECPALEKTILSTPITKSTPSEATPSIHIDIPILHIDTGGPGHMDSPPYQDHNDVPGPHNDQGHLDQPFGEGFHADYHGDQGYPQHWDKNDYPGHDDTPTHDDVGEAPNHKDISR